MSRLSRILKPALRSYLKKIAPCLMQITTVSQISSDMKMCPPTVMFRMNFHLYKESQGMMLYRLCVNVCGRGHRDIALVSILGLAFNRV